MPCWKLACKGRSGALYMPHGAGSRHRHAGLRRNRCAHSVVFGGFSAEACVDRLMIWCVKGGDHRRGGFRKDKAVGGAQAGLSCWYESTWPPATPAPLWNMVLVGAPTTSNRTAR